VQGAGESAGGFEVGWRGSGGGATAEGDISERLVDGNGGGAYKTQTVGGLELLSGTGVPLPELLLVTWEGIAEDMLSVSFVFVFVVVVFGLKLSGRDES